MEAAVQFFFESWDYVKLFLQHRLLMIQQAFFEDYFMTFGVYDRINEQFVVLYKYDTPLRFLYIVLKSLFVPKRDLLLSTRDVDAYVEETEKYIKIGSYFDGDGLHYMLNQHKRCNPRSKFVYCILNDEIDLTHEFESFKEPLTLNTTLAVEDIVLLLLHYVGRSSLLDRTDVDNLKLMQDDSFQEKSFKGIDLLHL